MKKFLICYQIMVIAGSMTTTVDGHCFVDMQRLTREEINRACAVILENLKEQYRTQNPIVWGAAEFRGPTLRSVTQLEDGPDEGMQRAVSSIPSLN